MSNPYKIFFDIDNPVHIIGNDLVNGHFNYLYINPRLLNIASVIPRLAAANDVGASTLVA